MAKADKCNYQVLEDPDFYVDLLYLKKVVSLDNVKLDPNASRRKFMAVGTNPFMHVTETEGYLQCRQNIKTKSHYNFQLFVKSFMPEPIFRFESDGISHNNKKELGLAERPVKTPHFQRYTRNGYSEAYRTEFIEENEPELLSDINIGLKEFCLECTLETKKGLIPVVLEQLSIPTELPKFDLHKNVNFV